MPLEPVLVDGEWRQSEHPAGTFRAVDPATKTESAEAYPVSSASEVERAVGAAAEAAAELRAVAPEDIAGFLERYAARIEAARDALVDVAARETGLPASPRLGQVELPRTVGQMRQARRGCERSFVVPRHDRHGGEHQVEVRPAGRRRGRLRPQQLPLRVQLDRGRRLRRGHRGGQPRDRQGQHRTPRHQPRVRRARRRRRARVGHASRDRAAHLPDAARRRVAARVAPRGRGHRVHGKQGGRAAAEGSRGPGRPADLPRNGEHEPGVRASRRARGARA